MRGEFLDLSGARIYYYAAGSRGAGVPVALIHGFPTSGHLWAEVVPLLPPGHRVVVLDLLGFGRSDPPRNYRVGIEGHAERVIELFNVLGISRACLVGHGLGGGVAQWVAACHPKRVSHLVLIDSVAGGVPLLGKTRLLNTLTSLGRHLPARMVMFCLRTALLRGYDDRERGARSLDMYLRPFISPEGRDALAEHLRALGRDDMNSLWARLPEIDVLTTVVWGARDPFLPSSLGEKLHRAIRRSRFRSIVDAKHFTPEEAPRVVADSIAEVLGVSP